MRIVWAMLWPGCWTAAFHIPTELIGPFATKEEAERLARLLQMPAAGHA